MHLTFFCQIKVCNVLPSIKGIDFSTKNILKLVFIDIMTLFISISDGIHDAVRKNLALEHMKSCFFSKIVERCKYFDGFLFDRLLFFEKSYWVCQKSSFLLQIWQFSTSTRCQFCLKICSSGYKWLFYSRQ